VPRPRLGKAVRLRYHGTAAGPRFRLPRSSRAARIRLGLVGLLLPVLITGCDVKRSFSMGLPRPATKQGSSIEEIWVGSVIAALAVGVVVWALILWAAFAYRRRNEELPRQVRYNLPIEVLYTVLPFVIVAVLFYYTAVKETYVDKLSANPDVKVGVVAFQWNWQFNYVGENVQVTGQPGVPPQLVLPVGKTVRFIETSPDVIHSFWVPSFIFKRDVIPGRINQFEVTITKPGTFIGHCAELCGVDHDRMSFSVKAVSDQDYRSYLATMRAQQPASAASAAALPTPASSS
jgi:cytochrome c oxidase subunit 2